MKKTEAKELAAYMDTVDKNVPIGLGDLKDVLQFAAIDLRAFAVTDKIGRHLPHAITFAKSIPKFTDFDSDEFNTWLIHDEAYLDYMSRTNL